MVDALLKLANDIKTNKCKTVETVFSNDLCQSVTGMKFKKNLLQNNIEQLNATREKFNILQGHQ